MSAAPDLRDFERHLTTILRTSADAVEIHPDLDGVIASTVIEPFPTRRASRSWWVAVAAALVLVVGLGVSQLVVDRDPTIATGAASGGEGADAAVSAPATSLIVWIEVDATAAEVEEMAGVLLDLPAVLEIATIDRDGAATALEDFIVIGPSGPRLVDPAVLPSAFTVGTDVPGDVGDAVTDLPALDGVENAS